MKNDEYIKYHDQEWGEEVHDETILFEMLILEGAQAGLSWETILKRREGYRQAFDNFDFKKIINYDDSKIEELMQNKDIIRNRLKIKSVIKNAKVFIDLQNKFGSFDNYIWSYISYKQLKNAFNTISDYPTETVISKDISKDLKKRGMSFVGPTIIYAFMQAIGMVNDHQPSCFKYYKNTCK